MYKVSTPLPTIPVVALDSQNVPTWTTTHQEVHPAASNWSLNRFLEIQRWDSRPMWPSAPSAKNLDLNSISYMATSDKDGQAGGGRQELQLSACQRSRHGRRLPPCRRSQVQFHHLWIVFDLIVLLFRDFGESREGRGQGPVQTRPAAGGNSFCCQMLWIYEVWHYNYGLKNMCTRWVVRGGWGGWRRSAAGWC